MPFQAKKQLSALVALITLAAFTSACASTTVIRSDPDGAKLYLNGEPVGQTPYAMTDTKIVGSTTTVRLEKQGYQSTYGVISRNEEFDVGACIGGVFLLVPFLWIMKYKPVHTFEMAPATATQANQMSGPGAPPSSPRVETPIPSPSAPPTEALAPQTN